MLLIRYIFLLISFKIFSLSLVSCNLNMIYPSIVLKIFFLLGVVWVCWICDFDVINFQIFQILLLQIFLLSFFSHCMYVTSFSIVPHFLDVPVFFFFFWFSVLVVSFDISSRPLVLSLSVSSLLIRLSKTFFLSYVKQIATGKLMYRKVNPMLEGWQPRGMGGDICILMVGSHCLYGRNQDTAVK